MCRKILIIISRWNINAVYVSTKTREAKWSFKTLSALLQYKQHGKKITYLLSNIPLSRPNMRYQGFWKECTLIKDSQWRVLHHLEPWKSLHSMDELSGLLKVHCQVGSRLDWLKGINVASNCASSYFLMHVQFQLG